MPYKTKCGSHYHETYGCHGATIPCDAAGLTPCSDCCGKAGAVGGTPSAASGGSGTAGGTPSGSQEPRRIEDGDVVRWKDDYQQPGEEGLLMVAIEPLHAEDGGNGSVYVKEIGSSLPYPPTMLTKIEYLELAGTGSQSAPDETFDASDMAAALGQGAGATPVPASDFEKVPRVDSIGKLRDKARFEGVRGDAYTVAIRDYDSRTAMTLDIRPHKARRDGREWLRVDWEDGYWDKHDYFFVPVDGDPTIDSVISYNDYEAERGKRVLRGMGMTDDDLRRIVADARKATS